MSQFDKETLQKRFKELSAEKEKLDAAIAPVKKTWEELRKQDAELAVKKKPVRQKIMDHNKVVGPIEEELAIVTRALGGKTGAR